MHNDAGEQKVKNIFFTIADKEGNTHCRLDPAERYPMIPKKERQRSSRESMSAVDFLESTRGKKKNKYLRIRSAHE